MQNSMSQDQITSQEDADVKDQNPTSQVQAESPATASGTSDTSAQDAPQTKEDLVKQLMQASVVEDAEPEVDEAKVDIPEEDAEPEAPEVAEKKEETETPPAAEPDILDDKRLGERTRKTVVALRNENKELKQLAAFGDLLTNVASKAQISPPDLADWVGLAASLKSGDKAAVQRLVETAKAFGYVEPTVEKRATVDDVADEIFRKEFAAEVEDLAISEATAKKYARKLAEERVKAVAPTPESRQQVPQQTVNPIVQHSLSMIDRMESEYKATVPNYDKIANRVTQRLTDEYGKADPIMWVAGYQEIVRDEVRKSTPPAAVKASIKPVAGTQLRSSAVTAPVAAPKDDKAQLVADLVSGKFFKNN
jgi:hypothetical protein